MIQIVYRGIFLLRKKRNQALRRMFDREVKRMSDAIVADLEKKHSIQRRQTEVRQSKEIENLICQHDERTNKLIESHERDLRRKDRDISKIKLDHQEEMHRKDERHAGQIEAEREKLRVTKADLENSMSKYDRAYSTLMAITRRNHETYMSLVGLTSTSSKVSSAFAEAVRFTEMLKEGTIRLDEEMERQKREIDAVQMAIASAGDNGNGNIRLMRKVKR